MVVRMRHTRAHTANRRSHHALKSKQLSKCDNCAVAKMPHKVCMACGSYKGNQIINKVKEVEKKQKKAKAKKAASK